MAPTGWVIDLLVTCKVHYEALLQPLESLFYNQQFPFAGPNRRYVADELLHLVREWFADCVRNNARLFGSEHTAMVVSQTMSMLAQSGVLDAEQQREAQDLLRKIERALN